MGDNDLTPEQLAAALARGAEGYYAHEAAVRVLVANGVWPGRLLAAGLIVVTETDGVRQAHVDWAAAVAAVQDRRLFGSRGEVRVLRVAASLGGSGAVLVDLADVVGGLDRANLSLLLAALSHAHGSQDQQDYVFERPAEGGPGVLRADAPRVDLGPVFDWPV